MYIYISCRIMEFKICIFWQHFFVDTNFMKYNRHFMSTYVMKKYWKYWFTETLFSSDEKILKTLIHRNILPTDPNKKIKLIIYYNKFKTSNLVIKNNSSPSIGVLQKNNVIYKFKCPLGDCISDNDSIGWFNLYYPVEETYNAPFWYKFNSSALKKHSCPTTQLRKILTDNTTIFEHQNNKQKLQILEALHIRNMQPTLNRINFQTSANVLECL